VTYTHWHPKRGCPQVFFFGLGFSQIDQETSVRDRMSLSLDGRISRKSFVPLESLVTCTVSNERDFGLDSEVQQAEGLMNVNRR
jgi:hypothetical protein